MARNSEKAMTKLARFYQMKVEEVRGVREKRPYLATMCDDLEEAEQYRRQIIGEIAKKVAQIQNAGLGEFRLRDLNDEINKLIREKRHWQDRIIELGGRNHFKTGPKMLENEGKAVPGGAVGYRYFGEAKNLPGVRELFEQEEVVAPRKTRSELMKYVDADYYGYRDDDDGVLLPLEREVEKELIASAVQDWKESIKSGKKLIDDEEEDIYGDDFVNQFSTTAPETEFDELTSSTTPLHRFVAHVPDVPTQEQVQQAILHKKKMVLLEEYASEAIIKQAEEMKTLMGE